jgi:hypothetical protein
MDAKLIARMVGAVCWHVSSGGATAPSFVLVLGDKILRSSPLKNPAQPEEFRNNRGSVELLVWSSWRLQTATDVLASSDQGDVGLNVLRRLVGLKIISASTKPPAWDLFIQFSDGTELLTFSDHVAPDASIDQNWELWAENRRLGAGPGSALAEE